MKKKFLLVDDETTLNIVNKKVLEAAGLVSELQIAHSGEEALEIFRKADTEKRFVPDIIVLDLEMPVMDGFKFIEAFQKMDFPDKEKVTIVVFTSSLNPKDRQRAHAMGIKYYLTKPYLLKGIEDVMHKEFTAYLE